MPACDACGAALPDGAAFCPQCGHRVAPLPARPATADLMRSERKLLTVLFADIKGSLALVAQRDPELAGDILAQVAREMGAAVRRFGGTVNQVMGDGIMALFGAPWAIEDHALQACLAALALRSAVHDRVQPRMQVRVGISSGEVVVSAVAGDVALHYSAAGEAVHMAARMEQSAGPDQILLTPAARQLAGRLAEVRSLGPVAIRGLDAPMEVFELTGVAKRRHAGGSAPRPDFVGRGAEMAQLRDALGHAMAGEARAVRLVGDAGSGKSRLVREFTANHLPEDWTLVQAEAVPHRQTSHAIVVDLLTRLFGLHPDDPAEIRREKLLAGLALPARAHPEEVLPPLLSLLGLRPLPPGWEALPARERRDRAIEGAALAFQRVSLRQPLALVIEDAHWLDVESAETVHRLTATVPRQRMLTLATERPGPSAIGGAWAECHVGSLDAAGTQDLLRRRLLPGQDVAALERKLIEHTQGNPLFIEECLESLLETGELVREDGQFRLTGPVGTLRVPDSLRGLLDARVDRLMATDKDVLQAASVVGSRVPVELLGNVLQRPATELQASLDRLCASGFMLADAADPGRYAFRHGLIREAAYNGILLRSRVRMHGAVLTALEQVAEADGDADLLADHASKAEAWPQAVAYSRRAAARAYDRYANPEAARLYRQALAAAGHWADGPEKRRIQLDLNIAIRWPLFRLGQIGGLRPHVEEAAALAAQHDDPRLLGQSHVLRSHVLWLAGDPDAAMAAAAAARSLGLAQGDVDLQVRATFQIGLVYLAQGRVNDIVAAMQTVLTHIGPAPPATGPYGLDAELAITCFSYMARAHCSAGQFAAAREAIGAARPLASKPQDWIWIHLAEGILHLAEGAPHTAMTVLDRAHASCRRADMRLLQPMVAGFLALAHVESGRVGRGLELAEEAVADAERMQFLALHPMRLAILAQAYLVAGDTAKAESTASAARAMAIGIQEPGAESYAVGLLGEAALRRGDAASAQALFTAALAQAEQLGLVPLAAAIRQRLEQPENRAHPWLDGIGLAP